MTVEYGKAEDMWWDIVEKEACIKLDVNGKIITGRVAQRWIAENCGASGTGLEHFDAVKASFDRISDLLLQRAHHGPYEENGTVLLR